MERLLSRMDGAPAVARLVELARGGDRAAADTLVRIHAREVYGVLARIVGNHEDAEDLTQEAFVRALGALDVFRGDGTFGAWLLRIAVHVGRDHVRRKGRAPERMALEELAGAALDVIDVKAGATPDAAPTERELADRLAWAIDRLPVGLRAALVLRVLEGRGYDEVAAVLGVRPATARTQVMKARRALEELLGPWLDAPGRGQS